MLRLLSDSANESLTSWMSVDNFVYFIFMEKVKQHGSPPDSLLFGKDVKIFFVELYNSFWILGEYLSNFCANPNTKSHNTLNFNN